MRFSPRAYSLVTANKVVLNDQLNNQLHYPFKVFNKEFLEGCSFVVPKGPVNDRSKDL